MTNPKDPHVWLDPVLYQKEAQLVANAFAKKDPSHAEFYAANLHTLESQLTTLDAEFKTGLRSCRQKDIITSHAAFGYLASRYGINQIALAGFSPDQEPSSQTMTDIAAFAETHQIKYIFFEQLVSPRVAETIAHEVGAQSIQFNPLEGLTATQQAQGENYFTTQHHNLINLRTALACL
jgi:zinc transport system substrate-binding protein